VLIKGPSGCGKTSLLESIAGFNSLFDVHIDSVKLSDENALSWSRQFSFVSQNYSQFPSRFLVENVKSNDSWRDKRYTVRR
jgi:ABC-type Fe3+/spermidine/putrescine transport system ATPase subunit